MNQTNLFEGMTLSDARGAVQSGLDKGIDCPCCNQFCKEYKRTIHATMSRGLIWLYRYFPADDKSSYVHVPTYAPNHIYGGDFAKMAYWGLIEELPKDPGNKRKRTSGCWRLTSLGRDFVEGLATVSKYAIIFNSTFFGVEGEQVSIHECLSDEFDYQALMGR